MFTELSGGRYRVPKLFTAKLYHSARIWVIRTTWSSQFTLTMDHNFGRRVKDKHVVRYKEIDFKEMLLTCSQQYYNERVWVFNVRKYGSYNTVEEGQQFIGNMSKPSTLIRENLLNSSTVKSDNVGNNVCLERTKKVTNRMCYVYVRLYSNLKGTRITRKSREGNWRLARHLRIAYTTTEGTIVSNSFAPSPTFHRRFVGILNSNQ
jgi:hypothetical protein